MNDKTMRFQVGVFVLGALLFLGVLITLFTGFPTLFQSNYPYVVVFSSAAGVNIGTPVRRSGVRIGEVRGLELDDETGKVQVTIHVNRKHPLRQGDQPILVHSLLGGDTSIDFVAQKTAAPQGEQPLAEPGSVLIGAKQSDVQTLLDQTSDLVPNTQATLDEIRKSLQRFERISPRMEEAASEHRDLAKAMRETIPEFRKTNDELRDLARASREAIPELRRTNDEIQTAARNWGKLGERTDVLLQTNQEKMIKALDDFTETVNRVSRVFNDENLRNLSTTLRNVRSGSENLDSISKTTEDLVKESRQTIRRINDSVAQTNEVLANLQRATRPMADRSTTVMKNLDESTDKLNRTLTDVREILRVLTQADGTLRRFLVDPDLYNNLNGIACMAAHTLPRLDRVLKDVEVFADKIARHPESLGLGGVVSPSSGLKMGPH